MPPEIDYHQMIVGLDQKLSSHIISTDNKLDTLIEISRTLATIQERQQRHSDEIRRWEVVQTDDRQRFLAQIEKLDSKHEVIELERKQVTARIFDKIDEVSRSKSGENIRREEEIERDIDKVTTRLTEISKQINKISTDLSSKTSFTKGALWVLGFLAAGGNLILSSYISDYKTKIENTDTKIVKLSDRATETEQELQTMQQQLNTVKQKVK